MIYALLIGCVLFLSQGLHAEEYYSPENILRFAEHLYDEGDYLRAASEYQRYLFFSSEDVDQIIYKIGLCYRLCGRPQKAIDWFEKILNEHQESNLLGSAYYQIGYAYLLMGEYEESILKMKEGLGRVKKKEEQVRFQHLIGLNYLKEKQWDNAYSLFDSLKEHDGLRESSLRLKRYAEEGENLSYKSPLLAGLLSSLVPGAGKIYCGRIKDGLYSLFFIGTAGWLAYNGFKVDGENSLKGWLWGIGGGVLYAGNIYGSTIAAKVCNRNLEDELFAKIQIEIDLFK
ncbi:MAG: tetratricopeptide repeat protein [bacterium]|nr:tetratricopeptide repeat protein [bacterium]